MVDNFRINIKMGHFHKIPLSVTQQNISLIFGDVYI